MVQEWLLKEIETQKRNQRSEAILDLGEVGDEDAIDPEPKRPDCCFGGAWENWRSWSHGGAYPSVRG